MPCFHTPHKWGGAYASLDMIQYRQVRLPISLLCLGLSLATRAGDVVTTCARLRELGDQETMSTVRFRLNGRVEARLTNKIVLSDLTGRVVLNILNHQLEQSPQRGDLLTVSGSVDLHEGDSLDGKILDCSATPVDHDAPDAPIDVRLRDLNTPQFDLHYVRTKGTVVYAMDDDLDATWFNLLLQDGNDFFAAAIPRGNILSPQRLKGAQVAICGVPMKHISGYRQFSGPYLESASENDITVLAPPPDDPFDIPPLGDLRHLSPHEISLLGTRSIVGRVIAAWRGDRFLVQTEWHKTILVLLNHDAILPACGETVKVVGTPETDLAHINLTKAEFKRHPDTAGHGTDRPDEEPVRLTADALVRDEWPTSRGLNVANRGRLVLLRGTVLGVPAPDDANAHFTIRSDGRILPVYPGPDVRHAPDVEIGSVVDVTGVCMIDTETWRPGMLFPRFTGHSVIMRRADDLSVVSRPHWWTPFRLTVVLSVLLAALVGTLFWIRLLQAVVVRRSRQLFKAQVSKLSSELRVAERTRLAVELHDSLAQNLAGISLEIDTAEKMAETDSDATRRHVAVAARALKSCRDDLRACLWDLRNSALEEPTMDEALRKTLAPHVSDTALSIRFNVPRKRLADNTAHAILRIVRELVVNAVRHGDATKIRVAGAIEGNDMRFSVQDNGTGFDPEKAPGFDEGHYGLVGIRERIDELEGEFTLVSTPGKGTKATIVLQVPQEEKEL